MLSDKLVAKFITKMAINVISARHVRGALNLKIQIYAMHVYAGERERVETTYETVTKIKITAWHAPIVFAQKEKNKNQIDDLSIAIKGAPNGMLDELDPFLMS